jgi:calmodulin
MKRIFTKETEIDDLSDYEEAFELFDKDGSGKISCSELKNLLHCFGKKGADKDIALIMSHFGIRDLEFEIDFPLFKEIMKKIMAEPDFDEDLVQMYRVFDPEEKGIDAQKLSVMMNKLVTLVDKNIPDYYVKESN